MAILAALCAVAAVICGFKLDEEVDKARAERKGWQ